MKKSRKSSTRMKRVGVLDFETFLENGIHVPYMAGFMLEGGKLHIVKGHGMNVAKALLNAIFEAIPTHEGKGRQVTTLYAHNLAKFDGHFLLGELNAFGIETLFKNEKTILQMEITSPARPNIKLVIRDSNLVIPGTLEKLAKTFGCETMKGVFPYSFVTRNTLGYIGHKPDIEFYEGISATDYQQIPS